MNLNQSFRRDIPPETTTNLVFARGEDSLAQHVYHFSEKCHTDPDLFEKVYCWDTMPFWTFAE